MELWGEEVIQCILDLADEFVGVDACTAKLRRISFVLACVWVDLSRQLWSGVLIDGPDGSRWQHFVWENVDGVCLQCGCFHPAAACPVDAAVG